MNNSTKYGLLSVVAIFTSISGLLIAWQYTGWDLQKASSIGDAVSPIVGVLSLAALAVALLSVKEQANANELQKQALATQESELREQRTAFEHELNLQRQSIELQQSALSEERLHRKRELLVASYVPLLSSHASWLESVREYTQRIRTTPSASKIQRTEWQRSVEDCHRNVREQLSKIRLVDSRRAHATSRAARPITLEPPLDTPEMHQKFVRVIWARILERRSLAVALEDALHLEFTGEQADEDPKARETQRLQLQRALDEARQVESEITNLLDEKPQTASD